MNLAWFENRPSLIQVSNQESSVFTVAGVMADLPLNTQLTFEFLRPAETGGEIFNQWDVKCLQTYVRLASGADPLQVSADSVHGQEVMNSLVELNDSDTTIVMVTQSLAFAAFGRRTVNHLRWADRHRTVRRRRSGLSRARRERVPGFRTPGSSNLPASSRPAPFFTTTVASTSRSYLRPVVTGD
jgi:hypothetical protein